ncbi:MAG: hypothetical protein K8R21_11285, partial [Leptospira sp.]|nr:hypothetical protein [Leptospira sp.]
SETTGDQISEEDISMREMLEEKESTSERLPVYIYSVETLPGLKATAKSIMDELKDRHRKIDKQGSKDIHPSFLLTLDKLAESLHKYTSLGVQAKSDQAIDLAIRQITDIENRGTNRIAYLYPFLIRDNNKIIAKIALIAPQTGEKVDVSAYRNACLRASEEFITLILSNRAKKPRTIDEDNPGQFLMQTNKAGNVWLQPKLGSLEAEVNSLVRKGFQPYNPLPVNDFVEDFINYGHSINSLIRVLPDYHLIVDELDLAEDGSYKKHPELINNYRAQADGLEKFAMIYLRKLAGEGGYELFLNKLNDYEINHIQGAPPGRKQGSDKVRALIDLIQEFPFTAINSDLCKKVNETCQVSIKILEKLIEEKDSLLQRKDDSSYKKLEDYVLRKIPEFTKSESKLMQIDIAAEFARAGFKDEEKIQDLKSQLKQAISAKFGTHEKESADGKEIFYAVDQSYMANVMNNLTALSLKDKRFRTQMEIAKKINAEMSNPKNPTYNANIKPDALLRLLDDTRRMEKAEEKKIRSDEFNKKFNLVAGLFAFLASIIFFATMSVTFNNISTLLLGFPVSAVAGLIASLVFKKKGQGSDSASDDHDSEITSGKSGNSPASDGLLKKEDKLNAIAKVAEKYIFGGNFNKIQDKIFDSKAIKQKVDHYLTDIKGSVPLLAKETDNNKVASSIEYAIMQTSVIIAVPDDLVPKNKPNSIIISRNDFKAPLIREQLAEFYRSEAEKNKHDKPLVKYYSFLINTLEVDYYKFLPKKGR